MPSSGLGAYQVKIHQIVFGGIFFFLVLLGVRAMMSGGVGGIKLLAVGSVLVAGALVLDKYYWVLCPLLILVSARIPGLPFDSGELGRILFIGIYFVRAAMQKEASGSFRKEVMLAFPYFIWVAAIYVMNPTGMSVLGSESIGGRFYFKIVLGFLTLICFSRLSITERDAKYWIYGLFGFLCVKFLVGLSGFSLFEVGENQTLYFLSGAAPILLLLLSHYDLRQIVALSWRLPVTVLLFLTVAASGKRSSMAQVLSVPFLIVFLRGREKLLLGILSAFAAIMLGSVIAGHGSFFHLPFSVQRSLSFLPGKWDQSLDNYGVKDLFRENLQRRAKEKIKASPFLGTKGYSIEREQVIWTISETRGDSMGGHGMVGNWHNKWYGMAADFGLPASVFWYFFAISATLYCLRNRTIARYGNYRSTLFLFYSLYMFYDLFFAFGHSALTPFQQWTYFGFVIALVRSVKETDRMNSLPCQVQPNGGLSA